MSLLFDKIKQQLENQLPFVSYCKPNSDAIITFFQKNDMLFQLDNDQCGFAFVSFDDSKRYIIPENQSDIYFEKIINSDFVYPKNRQFEADTRVKISFENMVKKAISEIENGTFEKVVLSRNEIVLLDSFDVEMIFSKLISNYKSAFNYCFFHPKIGFWMGATPEQFLKIEGKKIKTVSLAGTQLVIDNVKVKWNDKEVNEQKIVTNFITNNLKKYCEQVKFCEPYTFQAGSIVHIKTDIEAQFKNQSDLDKIITSLFPTPAVCGFPKEIAKEFILNNEGYNREFYAGYLGEWNKDFLTYKTQQSDLFVNLRCMKIENNKAKLFVGCGINKGSNPEKEYAETENKSQTMKNVL